MSQSIEYATFMREFEQQNSLGEGSYGRVYACRKRSTGQRYALKKIDCYKMDELSRAVMELSTASKLDSPHITKIYYHYMTEKQSVNAGNPLYLHSTIKQLGLIMELGKCSLEQDIRDHRITNRLYKMQELQTLMVSMIEVLATLQREKVSHRDIKPGNILVFDRRVFKLTDFGLSAVVGGAAKGHGGGGGAASNHGYQGPNEQGIAGTPCYMAPALYEYERAVAAYNNNVGLIGHVTRVARPEKPQTNYFVTDVFSLGLTLLQAATLQKVAGFNDKLQGQSLIEGALKTVERYYGEAGSRFFVEVLRTMLNFSETSRPDFVRLHEYLQSAASKEKLLSQSQLMSYVPEDQQIVLTAGKMSVEQFAVGGTQKQQGGGGSQQQQQQHYNNNNAMVMHTRQSHGEDAQKRTVVSQQQQQNQLLQRPQPSQGLVMHVEDNPFMHSYDPSLARNFFENQGDTQSFLKHFNTVRLEGTQGGASQSQQVVRQQPQQLLAPPCSQLLVHIYDLDCKLCDELHQLQLCSKCFKTFAYECHCTKCSQPWQHCECVCQRCRDSLVRFAPCLLAIRNQHAPCAQCFAENDLTYKRAYFNGRVCIKDIHLSTRGAIFCLHACSENTIAAGDEAGYVYVLDANTFDNRCTPFKAHRTTVLALASNGEQYIISAGADKRIIVLGVRESLQVLHTIEETARQSVATRLLYFAEEEILITGHANGNLHTFSKLFSNNTQYERLGTNLCEHKARIRGLFQYSATKFVTVCERGTTVLWNAKTFLPIKRISLAIKVTQALYSKSIGLQRTDLLVVSYTSPERRCRFLFKPFANDMRSYELNFTGAARENPTNYPYPRVKCPLFLYKDICFLLKDQQNIVVEEVNQTPGNGRVLDLNSTVLEHLAKQRGGALQDFLQGLALPAQQSFVVSTSCGRLLVYSFDISASKSRQK